MQTGGSLIFAYWEPDGLCVSLHLDTGQIPDVLISPDETVPVRITVNGHEVFAAS